MSELSRATGEASPEAAAVIEKIRSLLDRDLPDQEASVQLVRDMWHVYDAVRDAFPEAWYLANSAEGPGKAPYRVLCRAFDKVTPTVAKYVKTGRAIREEAA